MLRRRAAFLCCAAASGCTQAQEAAAPAAPLPAMRNSSVLYMVVDDMRPEMATAYQQSHLVTPAFDQRESPRSQPLHVPDSLWTDSVPLAP
eukprot:SAG25_NODE_253_length_10959_cov_17.097330_9_plen_91_part_00